MAVDYSHEFIDELINDIEANRVRAARVLPAPEGLTTLSNVGEIERRLHLLKKTGKRDYLIDIAKYAMRAWIALGDEPRKGVCW